jgi:hypothetical protein
VSDTDGVPYLLTTIPIEAECRYPVEGGGALVIGRGCWVCKIQVAPPTGGRRDAITMQGWIADDTGREFALERQISGKQLFELVRFAEPWGLSASAELLADVIFDIQERRLIPSFASGPAGVAPLAYYGKYLAGLLGLFVEPKRREWLILRVGPIAGGAIGGADAPETVLRTCMAGALVLYPELLAPEPCLGLGSTDIVFVETRDRGLAQCGVRWQAQR